MSSGQRPRWPYYFPRMKVRGNRRRFATDTRLFFGSLRNQPWVIYRDSDYSSISKEVR